MEGTQRGGATRRRWWWLLGLVVPAALAAVLLDCSGVRTHVKPPPPELRRVQTAEWLARIRDLGRSGDWLVIRGYKPTDDLVVAATNMPLSHVAVLDLETEEVIEAIGSGVQTAGLEYFVDHSHRVLLIRPKWWDDEAGREAVVDARSVVGGKYDFLGTVGLPSKKRYYCSELATWAYRRRHGEAEHLPRVIEPGQLYLWGEVLFDSGFRD